ncbi:MAG TPA: ABC transporter permease [Candidatus Saccharimonadales bacterium]|nr:ABC transporter permease [Candidatus Saccharimonadales bacterium]
MSNLLFIDHFQSAIHSLKTTRMRTLLTTLGVAIGVASVTTILALSGGISQVVGRQIDGLGGNIGVIRPGSPDKKTDLFSNPTIDRTYVSSTLTEKDIEDIQKIDSIESIAPLMVVTGSMRAENNTVSNGTILATTPELQTIAGIPIKDGQFIDSVTNRNTAVIGNQLSIDLFGTEQSIGKTFKIRQQIFTIIGVIKHMNDPINFNNVDFDRTAIISLESGKSFHQGVAEIQQINIRAKEADKLSETLKAVESQLLKNHDNEYDFTILSGKEIAEPSNRFFTALTSVMTAIAAISLVVGGIGIMNIMLVGVAERTREIGLRKAVGASNGNIIWQFLIEALIISILGGVLGYLGGYVLAFIISTFFTFGPAFTWHIALVAILLSVGVGTIFGIYPALRAAKKDPIESLRHYR